MSEATERFASVLEQLLPASQGWEETASSLVTETGAELLFTCGDKAAVLLVSADGTTPTLFRGLMERLVKMAKAPPSKAQPVSSVPWSSLFVIFVFEYDFPSDLRLFIGNDRRVLTPQRFIQGGWVSLSSGEANFRINRTPVETEMLQAVQQAASDTAAGKGRLRSKQPGGGAAMPIESSRDASRGREMAAAGGGRRSPLALVALLAVLGVGGFFGYPYMKQRFSAPSASESAAPMADAGDPAARPSGTASDPRSTSGSGRTSASAKTPTASPSPSPTPDTAAIARAMVKEGLAQWRKGDATGGLEKIDKALVTDPKCAAAHAAKGTIYSVMAQTYHQQGDPRWTETFNLAAQELVLATKQNPKDAEAFITLGVCLYRVSRFKEGKEAMSRAIALRPNDAQLYFQRAMCASQLNDEAAAVDDYTKAWDIGQMPQALFNRASCYVRLGQRDQAKADYAKVAACKDAALAQRASDNLQAMRQAEMTPTPIPGRFDSRYNQR